MVEERLFDPDRPPDQVGAALDADDSRYVFDVVARLWLLKETRGVISETAWRARAGAQKGLRAWIQWVSQHERPNSVFTDTTLPYTVRKLTLDKQRAEYVTALTLLDLAAFTRNAVLYDYQFTLPAAADNCYAINEALGEPVMISLPSTVAVDTAGRRGLQPSRQTPRVDKETLYHTYEQRNYGLGLVLEELFKEAIHESHQQLLGAGYDFISKSIADSWSIIVNRLVESWDLWHADLSWIETTDSYMTVLRLINLEGGPLSNEFDSRGNAERTFREQTLPLIAESNRRSYFNLRVSAMLDLPYVGNITRLPFRQQLYTFAAFAHRHLNQRLLVHEEIERHVSDYRTRYEVPDRPNLHLPVFLSIVLSRARTLDDFWSELAALRVQAAAFRSRRAEYEIALRNPANETATRRIDALRRALQDDANKIWQALPGPIAAGAAATLAAAVGSTPAMAVAGIGLLTTLGAVDAERRQLLMRRLLRPSEWFLTSTAGTARAIGSSLDDVRRLWDMNEPTSTYLSNRLQGMSKLGFI